VDNAGLDFAGGEPQKECADQWGSIGLGLSGGMATAVA
jgi:hypothetical protein